MCYIIFTDNTEKEEIHMKHGYSLVVGNKMYFMSTDKTRKTKTVVEEFMTKLGQHRGLCSDLIERCKADLECFKQIQCGMDLCTLELRTAGTVQYYSIVGSNFTMSIPLSEADCLIIF